ncbi:MAG: aminoglycoside phosphotransferase family protein [candidate division Zixibacteria bacterium]|nr:aminoglycoside phosphotransferase family protein [candidate division Zixibacteria bacterium]
MKTIPAVGGGLAATGLTISNQTVLNQTMLKITGNIPQDDALPGLELLRNPELFTRTLAPLLDNGCGPCRTLNVRVAKYRPGRRLTVELTVQAGEMQRTVYAKLYYNDRGKEIFETVDALRRVNNSHTLSIIKPLAYIESARTLLLECATGTPLDILLGENAASAEPVAQAICQLHSLPPVSARIWTYDNELKIVEGRLNELQQALPELATRTHTYRRTLERALARLTAPEKLSNIHRDLYPKNALVNGTGSEAQVWLLDLDDMATGDPRIDIGNLLAEVELEGLEGNRNLGAFKEWNRVFLSAYMRNNSAILASEIGVFKSITFARNSGINAVKENLRWTSGPLLAAAEKALGRT